MGMIANFLKFSLILSFVFCSLALEAKDKNKYDKNGIYYMTPFGPVKRLTPKERKEKEKKEFKEKYGREDKTVGVEFKTRAIREKNGDEETLSVYVRGCGKIKLKALSEAEKEQKSLDGIKNGEYLKVKMVGGQDCTVGSWERIFD